MGEGSHLFSRKVAFAVRQVASALSEVGAVTPSEAFAIQLCDWFFLERSALFGRFGSQQAHRRAC